MGHTTKKVAPPSSKKQKKPTAAPVTETNDSSSSSGSDTPASDEGQEPTSPEETTTTVHSESTDTNDMKPRRRHRHKGRTAAGHRRHRNQLARILRAQRHSDTLSLPKTQVLLVARHTLAEHDCMHIKSVAINAIQHSVEAHIRTVMAALAIHAKSVGRNTVMLRDYKILAKLAALGPLRLVSPIPAVADGEEEN